MHGVRSATAAVSVSVKAIVATHGSCQKPLKSLSASGEWRPISSLFRLLRFASTSTVAVFLRESRVYDLPAPVDDFSISSFGSPPSGSGGSKTRLSGGKAAAKWTSCWSAHILEGHSNVRVIRKPSVCRRAMPPLVPATTLTSRCSIHRTRLVLNFGTVLYV